ncbi:hypothetical protein LY474_39405 [Myxococcus stipitatus]|uniref:hypothetical protein n=1 Tax=Myxococcus stipitatus TaxID=83455 RepID=UPI001F391A7B|nr:hypothetical protein [Myxococcus stipitatus]MCE9673880.1 hypothetical protein [Myxococcus stipitatus]
MRTCLLFAAALALGGCYDRASYEYGQSLKDLTLSVYDPTMGIHPSKLVLEDPNNPFANSMPGELTKWDIQTSAGPVASFYAWATILANGAYGEAQYYTAVNLVGVYQNGLANQADLPVVREMAIGGYQAMLDNFPDAWAYDASGQPAYDLATPAFKAIVELGGTVSGGWVLVRTSSGTDKAVRP